MDEINYPTAYALYEIKKYTGHDMCGLPIIDTDCFVVMPCYITKHTVKYDYDGKIHEEYDVIFMKKEQDDTFVDVDNVIFEEPQVVSFISADYETMKSECHKENGKLLIKKYNLSTPVEIARVRNEFYQRQEELQEKVNGNNSVLRLSNKDYNE